MSAVVGVERPAPVSAETAAARRNAHRPSRPSDFPGFRDDRQVRPSPAARQRPAQRRQGGTQRRSQRPAVSLTRRDPGGTAYQNVILAEFIAAILLVAATPFAGAKTNKAGVSPYAASDMLQLGAITLVYLLLALVSGANNSAARFSAWFGGLILLTVGLGEAARLAGLIGSLGLQGATPTGGSSGGA